MNSLDPKITTAIYFGGATLFLIALLILFFYTRSMKIKKSSGSREADILRETEKKEKVR